MAYDILRIKLNGEMAEVRKDEDGRYCLNDIHKAANKPATKRPVNFMEYVGSDLDKVNVDKNGQISDHLIQDLDSHVLIRGKGRGAASYGSLNTVYRYASFISKDFEKSVYEAFTALAEGDVERASMLMEEITISPELVEKADMMRRKMNEAIAETFPDSKSYVYANFNRLITKGATGFTPKELTNGMHSSVEHMIQQGHEPALSAQIASYEIAIRMMTIPNISYHDIATVLGVETTKNKKRLKKIS